jgi:ABC-2 type transport system permease protein
MRHEIKDLLKNPAIMVVILMPIFMSKVITAAMSKSDAGFLLLAIWILFAQVMVGIMLTGPNLIEEREGKTIDALLCSPLNFWHILTAKGLTILLFSILSQLFVFIVNEGFKAVILKLLLPMIVGGIIFVEIGAIIGFKISSSKNGSAVSAAVMVSLFLIVSVYKTLPEWTYKIFVFIPSIGITEVLNNLIQNGGFLLLESILSLAWAVGLGFWLAIIGKKY